MAILKLANGPITMQVASISQVESKLPDGAPQYLLRSTSDDTMYIGKDAADRQFARVGLTLDTIPGQTLHFEQVKKDGRLYTNVSLGAKGAAVTQGASAAAPAAAAAPAPKLTVADAAKVYADCFEQAMAIVGAKCEAAEVPFSGTDLVAAAATLFIRVMR
jgi:hypothetical protein